MQYNKEVNFIKYFSPLRRIYMKKDRRKKGEMLKDKKERVKMKGTWKELC